MNEKGTSKNLSHLCVDALYDKGKTIVENSEKKEQQAQSTLHNLIKVFKLWNSTSIVQQCKDEEWKVCIQDLGQAADSITLTLSLHSSEEFGRFEAFLRHLSSNWFRDIKAQKLDNGYLSFVVTHPVPVLLNIFPKQHTTIDEHLVLSTSKSSHIETVSRIIRRLLKDFCLCVQNESGKLLGDSNKKDQTKKTRSQSTDEYPEFQKTGSDTFFGDFYCNLNTPCEVLLEQLKQAYTSALNANQKSQFKEQRLAFEPSSEVKRLQAENGKLKKIIELRSFETEAKTEELELQVNKLKKKCNEMAMALTQKDTEIQETLSELGRLNVELTRMQNERKRDELFTKTFKRHSASTQTLEIPEWSTTSLDTRTPDNQSTSTEMNRAEDENNPHEKHHGQESVNETACLSDIPRTSIDGNIYNNYKLLFLRIAGDLLSDDVRKLKQWVETEFQIDTSGDVNALLLELDRMKIISITDLSRLRRFFETGPRYDLVCLIDSFLLGDYEQLKKTSRSRGSSNRGVNSQNGLGFQRFAYRPQWPPPAATRGRYTAMSHRPAEQSRDNAPSVERKSQGVSRANAREPQIGDHGSVTTPNTTHRPDAGNGLASRKAHIVALQRPSTSASRAKETVRSINNTTQRQGVLVTDSGTREQHEVEARDSTVRGDQSSNTSRYTNPGSNGQKLSKFQRPDDDDDDDSRWLCSHYKRHCYVKFECCNKFWPCHRCHNNQSTCGRRKLKSRDTVQVKCAACNQEQPFAQYCSRCNAKFARYFCGLCKHLTGTDDNPYHCEKCGICRIHGDRSFHCDVCGVCLDVQLRGNHKCRAGSAHDECCICLEDAFTGCQILPCSHKVHKECATQMIRSGITRCPICRESFAHKLERRPFKKPP